MLKSSRTGQRDRQRDTTDSIICFSTVVWVDHAFRMQTQLPPKVLGQEGELKCFCCARKPFVCEINRFSFYSPLFTSRHDKQQRTEYTVYQTSKFFKSINWVDVPILLEGIRITWAIDRLNINPMDRPLSVTAASLYCCWTVRKFALISDKEKHFPVSDACFFNWYWYTGETQ